MQLKLFTKRQMKTKNDFTSLCVCNKILFHFYFGDITLKTKNNNTFVCVCVCMCII